jgi:hypothetical protein
MMKASMQSKEALLLDLKTHESSFLHVERISPNIHVDPIYTYARAYSLVHSHRSLLDT